MITMLLSGVPAAVCSAEQAGVREEPDSPEVTALVAFLGTLHPPGELPARDPAAAPIVAATP